MGKRSGFPHRDDELAQMSIDEIAKEVARIEMMISIAQSAKAEKQLRKRRHWLESALEKKVHI